MALHIIFIGRTCKVSSLSAAPHNSEVFGISAHVKHEPYNRYQREDYRYKHTHYPSYQCHFATETGNLLELSLKTANTITGISLTNPRLRLSALGDFVWIILYKVLNEAGPTVVLYERQGDCSEKSGLMAGITQNDLWKRSSI